VHWEGTLNTNTVGNLTNGESLAQAIALAAHNDSLEDLKAALATFDNTDVNLELITGTKLWDVMAQGYCIYGVKDVHRSYLISLYRLKALAVAVQTHILPYEGPST
jgi:hypothetical protein